MMLILKDCPGSQKRSKPLLGGLVALHQALKNLREKPQGIIFHSDKEVANIVGINTLNN